MEVSLSFPPNLANPTNYLPPLTEKHLNESLANLGLSSMEDIPDKWDPRENMTLLGSKHKLAGTRLLPPSNQLKCGNCWAFSSTNALTDKFLIYKDLKGLELNQLLTTICTPTQNEQCGGGVPLYAAKFFEKFGAVNSPDCLPSWEDYCKDPAHQCTIPNQVILPTCSSVYECTTAYKAVNGSSKLLLQAGDPYKTLATIKTAIMTSGPVVGMFAVYNDLQLGTGVLPTTNGQHYRWNATDGIYIQGSYATDINNIIPRLSLKSQQLIKSKPLDGLDGYHAVEIIGWDSAMVNINNKKQNVPYWIIKNSWGETWNLDGYWKHAMYPYNQKCAIDYTPDPGKGGCTTFEANLETGGKRGTTVGSVASGGPSNGSGSSNDVKKIVMWIAISIASVVLLYLIVKGIIKLFKSRRTGSYR